MFKKKHVKDIAARFMKEGRNHVREAKDLLGAASMHMLTSHIGQKEISEKSEQIADEVFNFLDGLRKKRIVKCEATFVTAVSLGVNIFIVNSADEMEKKFNEEG